jgi:hypothetical protein
MISASGRLAASTWCWVQANPGLPFRYGVEVIQMKAGTQF